jgi:hypothetical protein
VRRSARHPRVESERPLCLPPIAASAKRERWQWVKTRQHRPIRQQAGHEPPFQLPGQPSQHWSFAREVESHRRISSGGLPKVYRHLRAVAKDQKFDCDSASVVIFIFMNNICRRIRVLNHDVPTRGVPVRRVTEKQIRSNSLAFVLVHSLARRPIQSNPFHNRSRSVPPADTQSHRARPEGRGVRARRTIVPSQDRGSAVERIVNEESHIGARALQCGPEVEEIHGRVRCVAGKVVGRSRIIVLERARIAAAKDVFRSQNRSGAS